MTHRTDERSFWIDPGRDRALSYPQLIERLNAGRGVRRVIREGEPAEIFTRLVTALLRDVSITLVDPELSPAESARLGVAAGGDETMEFDTSVSVADPADLVARVPASRATVYLYTSGTTGVPRRVGHQVPALARAARVGREHEPDVWGFAYHPMHFAGLQVFFQAFLNGNPMVDVRELSGPAFRDAVESSGVTNLSATPTFYRRLLASEPPPMPGVRRITFGGERLDPVLAQEVRRVFPNARVRNVYASTEAGSLFAADDDVFRVGPGIAGRLRISDDGEVLLHVSLLGDFERDLVDGEWFRTGDMVERVGEGAFRFVSRRTETINVGGYKVNPHEVEEVIRRVPGVQDVVVRGRPNRVTGNVLEAEVVIAPGGNARALEDAIRQATGGVLQPYKLPRIYRFVDSIPRTRTGKKARA